MCLFFMQLLEVRDEYFPHITTNTLRKVYDLHDVKEPRTENYVIDLLCTYK